MDLGAALFEADLVHQLVDEVDAAAARGLAVFRGKGGCMSGSWRMLQGRLSPQ